MKRNPDNNNIVTDEIEKEKGIGEEGEKGDTRRKVPIMQTS